MDSRNSTQFAPVHIHASLRCPTDHLCLDFVTRASRPQTYNIQSYHQHAWGATAPSPLLDRGWVVLTWYCALSRKQPPCPALIFSCNAPVGDALVFTKQYKYVQMIPRPLQIRSQSILVVVYSCIKCCPLVIRSLKKHFKTRCKWGLSNTLVGKFRKANYRKLFAVDMSKMQLGCTTRFILGPLLFSFYIPENYMQMKDKISWCYFGFWT